MARIYRRTQTTVSVVSSDSLTADTISTTAPTVLDLTSAGNADGATEIDFFVTLSAAGASLSGINLHVETSEDGTNYTDKQYALTGAITATGAVSLGLIYSPAAYTKCYLEPIDDTATATLEAVPYHYADA